MSTTDKKLKLLLFGAVNDNIEAFTNKVKSLHKSKAGPFDLCFCVGSFHVPSATDDIRSSAYQALQELPIPVYLQDALTTDDDNNNEEEIQTVIAPNLKAFPSTKANMYNIEVPSHPHVQLVVASCPRNLRMDDAASVKPLMDKLKHVSYVGCDLLLTSHWPQGMEQLVVTAADSADIRSQAQKCTTYDVAEVALRARARYHIVPAHSSINQYWQSPPFRHLAAATSTVKPQHTGRLIAVGHVQTAKKVPKENKFVHALGVVPLHSMDAQELQQSVGQGVAPCPFTDEAYSKDAGTTNANNAMTTTNNNFGLSEAQARRIIAEGGQHASQQRWNLNKNNKRQRQNDNPNNDGEEEEVDPTNTTLFVHGLHRDVSGQLQLASDPTLLGAFSPFGAAKVRRPPNAATTSFAFIEFDSHEKAKLCLETLGGDTKINGVHLTLKWGKHNNSNNNNAQNKQDHKRRRLTEADAKDSCTLYFRLPKSVPPETYDTASEHVRKWMEVTLEDALNEEGSEERVTAADEPALQVSLHERKSPEQFFGFLDFASHAAASMALATLTGSTDGGLVRNPKGGDEEDADKTNENKPEPKEKDDDKDKGDTKPEEGTPADSKNNEKEGESTNTENGNDGKPRESSNTEENGGKSQEEAKSEVAATTNGADKTEEGASDNESKPLKKIWGLALHWAHGTTEKTEHNKESQVIQDADCDFQFQRQHFPADARKDCWFCLASEGCEKHLITGVYQQCYSAMPKGPIHKGHVLLIPVAHSSQGAFMDRAVSREIRELLQALRRHAREEYGMDLFVFERAIQTRGGYHTHVQCVPVPKGLGVKLETTLRAQGKANQIEFREIQSPEMEISTLLQQDEEEDGGYFYAEVPMPGSRLEYKRFLHKVQGEQEGTRRAKVPLQFGREVIAAVLGKKELAHWKSCVVEKEEETKLAVDLRQSLENNNVGG